MYSMGLYWNCLMTYNQCQANMARRWEALVPYYFPTATQYIQVPITEWHRGFKRHITRLDASYRIHTSHDHWGKHRSPRGVSLGNIGSWGLGITTCFLPSKFCLCFVMVVMVALHSSKGICYIVRAIINCHMKPIKKIYSDWLILFQRS